MFIDTHTHLYLEEFNPDRHLTIKRAIDNDVSQMLLPNIDSSSWLSMLELSGQFPSNCFPMAGLHPTSVTSDNMEKELIRVEEFLSKGGFCAVGEIGIDLYWDSTFQSEQEVAFRTQLQWAKRFHLPVAIHMRNSFEEVWVVVQKELNPELKGVFHCFSGNIEQARLITEAGFMLGIGGVITFKNSGLQEVVKEIGLDYLILETDAPYLAPVPYRGKRNEPSYIPIIASKIAEITGHTLQEVADITTENARKLFKLPLV
jgi:TatD DNase family protein